ncbi:MAG: hypothetical protein PWR17_1317 [Candidatus Methanomethylophilaceae archaeon]|nr:hypothetical protein [Candidatus Methanomethylophilaceae archaeon]
MAGISKMMPHQTNKIFSSSKDGGGEYFHRILPAFLQGAFRISRLNESFHFCNLYHAFDLKLFIDRCIVRYGFSNSSSDGILLVFLLPGLAAPNVAKNAYFVPDGVAGFLTK